MRSRPLRRLGAFAGAFLIGVGGLAAPALADPDPLDSPPGITADGPSDDALEERVDAIVLLDDQPTTLSESGETSILAAQQARIDEWSETYDLEVDQRFGYLVNGFSVSMPASQMPALGLEPGVASVRRERIYERTEHTARELHGVPAAFAEHDVDGRGTVVSIIDSGIDTSHPDMRLDDGVCDEHAVVPVNTSPEAADGGFTCKVPQGYNYADESFVVKDATVSAHGQHVGGIVGANGTDDASAAELPHVDGVAPNAQLLAMKVFSNQGGGARDADIVAAIEDSVKLDADVINMSLGSPNGQKDASDLTSIAIDSARDSGVLTVIAAGNDGLNWSPTATDDDLFGMHDDGTVGSPATKGSALSVASIENGALTFTVAYANGPGFEGADAELTYSHATGDVASESDIEIVDAGLALPEDVEGLDLEGRYALVERGEISFTEKYENVIAAGAAGIAVFNDEANGDATFGMAGVEDFDLPGIVISRTGGLELRASIELGETTIRPSLEVDTEPNPAELTPSAFTSWGATPGLDFEPEIAGIGGNVYSTYNDGTYGMSSGTSMASPNVAGLAALLFQHLAEARPDLTGPERVDLAQVLLMNTALIPTDDDGLPYSPRQVGAGLALVDRALATDVTATVDGEGAATLREIDGSATFEVTLENTGDADAVFEIPSGQDVLAETNGSDAPEAVRISDGSLAVDAERVTVPAGGAATVTATLTPETGDDHVVGGWLAFDSADESQPSLTLPYLGFAGDWNDEPIIAEPGHEIPAALELDTLLLTSFGGQAVPLHNEAGEFWLSPNDDGDMDVVAPMLFVLRNGSDLRYEILDEDGESVKVVGEEQGLYRPILEDYLTAPNPTSLQWQGPAFDGTIYDPQSMEYEALPDGEYTYRVSTRLTEDSPWQHTDLEFGLDATAPEIEFASYDPDLGLLTFEVIEEGSGLVELPTATGAGGETLEVVEAPDGSYSIAVDPEEVPYLTVTAIDHGMTLAAASYVLDSDTTLVVDDLDGALVGPESLLVEDGALLVTGYAADDVLTVRVDGEEHPVEDGRFTAPTPLVEGENEIAVEALGDEAEVLASAEVTVTYDATGPELALDEGQLDEQDRLVLADDGSATLTGTAADERESAELSVTAGEAEADVADDGTFAITVAPGDEIPAVVLTASDGLNTTSTTLPIAGREAETEWELPEVTNADCVLESGLCFVPGDTPDIVEVDEDGQLFTLRGEYPGGGSITMTPAAGVNDDGEYVTHDPIEAQIGEDGGFALELPVGTGQNHFRFEVTDADGTLRMDRGVSLYVDVVAPTLEIDEPTLIGGTLYANDPQLTVAGTASDDGWGYTLSLNDSVVIERLDLSSPGEASNRREFSSEVTVADGDTMLVEFFDANGNALVGLIPVVLDEAAPEVQIDGIADGGTVPSTREATIAASDENLATLDVYLDGELVDAQSTSLTSEEHAFEDALIDAREAASAGTRTTAVEDALEATVSAEGLEPGTYDLVAVSTDLAGNETVEGLSFRVAAADELELEVTAPDAIELEIDREQLGDQAGLADLVLEQAEATLNGSAEDAAAADAQLALAPFTTLVEGEQTVTILASDDEGRTAETGADVTIALTVRTLTDGDVTATSTFRSDDELTASIAEVDGARELTIANREGFSSLQSAITVPGEEDSTVVRILPDGVEVPVAATYEDGVLTFEGPSKGTYLVTAPQSSGDGPVDDGGDGSGPGQGGGSDGGSGADDGSGSGSGGGVLASTGMQGYLMAGLIVLLLAGGGALLIGSRRTGGGS